MDSENAICFLLQLSLPQFPLCCVVMRRTNKSRLITLPASPVTALVPSKKKEKKKKKKKKKRKKVDEK